MKRVAVFRPDDGRLDRAVEFLESLGVAPVVDPLLSIEPTGALPRSDADYVVVTSQAGAERLAEAKWTSGEATLCAIGPATAAALRDAGYQVDRIPETYSSRGLIDALGDEVAGKRVEIARSDHGSDVLLDGLDEVGAYHHETVLYRLVRPTEAGDATELAAAGELAGVLFTSSLTVEYFLEAAEERGLTAELLDGLRGAVVGVIGEPTRRTAEAAGIDVDVVPTEATFEALARAVVAEWTESQ